MAECEMDQYVFIRLQEDQESEMNLEEQLGQNTFLCKM